MGESSRERAGAAVRAVFFVVAIVLVTFLVSLMVRSTGSFYMPVDGWGVDGFELAMGALCIGRFFERSWRAGRSVTKVFPLVLGCAALCWGAGDCALTVESLGGANPPTPSIADAFYVGFFPLCFVAFVLVIRRGNVGSLVATSLDGLIAGLGAASLSAAFVFVAVLKVDGGTGLSVATNMAYPVGDFLLLALALGGLMILPKQYRRFLVIACLAMATNAVGDMYHLLQPGSKIGYVVDGGAWPVSLAMLALATWVPSAAEWVRPVRRGRADTDAKAGFVLPAAGASASMVVLGVATFGNVSKVALGLASATLFVAGVRLALTVREARALNSARFRSLVDNAWDIIVVAEIDLTVAYITPSSQRVLGYTPAEVDGIHLTDLVHPDDVAEMGDQLQALAEGPERTASFEIRMRHRDGVWRIIAWTATNLLNDPAIRGFVLNGGDVTDARHAAQDLAAARDGALLASKAKSDFLSTMSHEIRTPMNGVIGLTELLLGTDLDHDQQELASGVKVSAENLLVIINDILDFSKIEAGKLEIEQVPLSVPAVADNVGRILAATAHSKGLELLVDVAPDVPTELLGDPVRIQQILLNLGSNAVKFSPSGEVVVRVAVTGHTAERVAMRFEVIDMGIGIAASDQERLFQVFSQADSSTTRKFGGTGLGLAICRQLVELMGGTLGVRSAPGQGSTFWFELSMSRVVDLVPDAPVRAVRNIAGQRALIVDDNATNRKILRQQLRSWDVDTVEAVDAYDAIEVAVSAGEASNAFDFGVIDLNMPGMDGIELARILKAHVATADMTLFLLSSSGERLGAAESHLRGFAASLTKPVRQSELFDCIMSSMHLAPVVAAVDDSSRAMATADGSGLVLLVEDNRMNQLVGSRVLTKLGYAFEVANHGGEAVAALGARHYDAVLMDCQMPQMDGYEATAAIRRLEGAERHTPIIAMTAAAMDGDRETCLAAGMDDYITKPIRPEVVAAVLRKWIVQVAEEGPAITGVSAEGGDGGPLDQAQIAVLRSLDDGDGAIFGEIAEQYLLQTKQSRNELLRVVDDGDARALERTAHMLRGASANIGATVLAALCAEMEMQGRADRFDDATRLVHEFDVEFARVKDALTALTTVT